MSTLLIEERLRALEKRYETERGSLYEFLKTYRRIEKREELDENRHIKEICFKLEQVYRGEVKRLMINIPPRALKTEIVSKAFPVWCMGQDAKKFLAVSYSAELAQRNSGGARDMYNSDTYESIFPRRAELKEDQNTKQHWDTENGSQYYATGSTGSITGTGADIIIIDDPIKPGDVDSDLIRTSINNNFHDTIKSRLNNKKEGAIVIIMQRLHDDDLCGHLLNQEELGIGEKRDKLIIPAIDEKGESFFERRFPIDILKQLQQEDKLVFSCQYLQEPINKETQEFHEEWFRYYNEIPKDGRIFTACDPAFTKNQSSDYSCIMTAKFVGMDMYILEYTVGRFNPAELIDKMLYHIKKWRPEKIGIEAFQAQQMIGFNLNAELMKRGLFTDVEDIKQTGDKNTKIRRLVPLYRNGHIYHQVGMEELEQQLIKFPRGRHDDMIDAEQMLYDLYEIQPNTQGYARSVKIEYGQDGRPLLIDY